MALVTAQYWWHVQLQYASAEPRYVLCSEAVSAYYPLQQAHESQEGPIAEASLTTTGTTTPAMASPESTPDVAGALDALAVDVSSISSTVEGASGPVPTAFDTTVASAASISATLSSAPEPAGSRAGLILDAVGPSMDAATAASDALGSAFNAANALGAEPAITAARDAAAATVVAVEAASASTAALPLTGGEAYLLLACLFFSVCTGGSHSTRTCSKELNS